MVNSLKDKSILIIASLLLSFVAFIILIVSAIYFSNKGFEISDETFYLYFSEHINPKIYLTQNFGILNKIACFGQLSIANLRLAKLFYQLAAILFFSYSLLSYLKSKHIILSKNHQVLITIILCMSSFVNYDYLPMTLSYNTWTLILGLVGFSLILLELSKTTKITQVICSFSIGFVVFGLFLVKFPNAIIMLGIYGFINLFYNKNYWGIKFVAFFTGIIFSFFVLLHNVSDFRNIIENYKAVLFDIQYISPNSYPIQLIDFWNICVNLGYIKFELAIVLLTVLIYRFNQKKRLLINYLPILINCIAACFFFIGNSQNLYNDFIVIGLLMMNVIIYVAFNRDRVAKEAMFSEINVVVFLLILTPILLMIGTNNLFYYTASQTSCFCIAGLIILVTNTRKVDHVFVPLMSVLVCAFALSVNYNGAIKTPYRQNNLLEKKFPIHFHPSIDGIYESYDRFVDYTALNILVTRLNSKNSDVVTFFNYIGLSYIANVKFSPESPISDADYLIDANKYILNREKFNNSADLLVVPSTVHNSIAFKNMFELYGITLGSNYKLVYSYTFLSTKEIVFFYKKV